MDVELKRFAYDHLPAPLQEVSRPFAELAAVVAAHPHRYDNAENDCLVREALGRLWETKNLAVLLTARP